MDQRKAEFVWLPSKKEEDDLMEQAWKRIKEESRLRKMKMAAAAVSGNIKQTEEDDTDEFEELLEGTVVLSPKESSTNNPKGVMKMNVEQAAAAGNNQDEELILSPKESSTNNPKGVMKMNVEQAAAGNNQDEELILSPKESSTNNPKGIIMKMNVEQAAAGSNQDEELILSPKESSTNNPKGQKRVREEEEEEEDKDKEKKLKAADSLSDFDEDDEMWSSLGDL